jgi:putative acetyltransferase
MTGRLTIAVDDLSGPGIARFLEEHVAQMRAITPLESKHALDLDALRQPEITFWSVTDGGVLVGCGAIKRLDATRAEVKSMRTAPVRQRSGIASFLLGHIIAEAVRLGLSRLSLETGSTEFFLPARKLYEKFGFEYCGPFADYRPDPHSVFMTRTLERFSVSTISERLELRPMPWDAVEAIVHGDRRPDWAEDFPADGDRVIAGILYKSGARVHDRWGHYQVVERASGAVVGGIGFFGPPEDGVTEIGYGIVPSRQGHGYATEAVNAMVAIAWESPGTTTVIANTDTDNVASQRVLEKAGFVLEETADGWTATLGRPQ